VEKNMNTKQMIAALAVFAAAGSASAQQIYPFVEHTGYVSSVSRADFQTAAKASNATTQPAATSSEFTDYTKVATEKTRAEVRAELAAEHEFQVARNPEFTDATRFASAKTRDEVRREAIQAARAASKVSGS
jgi:hypothetical protein